MTADDQESAVNATSELDRLNALPLEQRAAALAETVRRLEAELDATEATGATEATAEARATRTGPAAN
jgi:uncharacterized small protein (DUF1192 family)